MARFLSPTPAPPNASSVFSVQIAREELNNYSGWNTRRNFAVVRVLSKQPKWLELQ
jgi:hypothetical protein